MRISSQLYRNGQVPLCGGNPIVRHRKARKTVSLNGRAYLKSLKKEIMLGHFVGHTMSDMVKATGFTRHQLRHAGVNTRLLALGSMNPNLNNSTLERIWMVSQATINRDFRKIQNKSPRWFDHDSSEFYKIAVEVEQERANKFKKILR